MTKRSGKIDLDLRFYFPSFLLESRVLDVLQAQLCERASAWSAGARVFVHGEKPGQIAMASPGALKEAVAREASVRGSLFAQLQAQFGAPVAGSERVFGSAEIRGANSSLVVLVDVDQTTMVDSGGRSIWGNRVTIQVRSAKVEGAGAPEWSRSFFETLSAATSPAYAYAASEEEYWHKNMISDERGTEAVGIDFKTRLPGLLLAEYLWRVLLAEARSRAVALARGCRSAAA